MNYNFSILTFAKDFLPKNKEVFFIYTCGAKKTTYTKSIKEVILEKNPKILGEYGCLGFDTYGPFKLIGGIAKNHPTQQKIEDAVKFYNSL